MGFYLYLFMYLFNTNTRAFAWLKTRIVGVGTAKASHIKDKLVEMAYLNENIAGTAMVRAPQAFPFPNNNVLCSFFI